MTKALLQQAFDYIDNVPDDRCWGDYRDHRELAQALQAAIDAPEVEPVFWYRPVSNGEMYEGPVHHKSIDGKRLRDEKPGEWKPLYTEPPDTAALRLELDRVNSDNAKMLRNIQMFSDVIDNHCIAMQSALIANHLENPRSGLQWIYNTLRGPGLLPDICEAIELGGAQAWFDAKSAEREKAKAIAAQGEPNAK